MGFVGLLLLMVAMAIDSARAVHNLAATSAALRKELRERDGLLDRLRLDIQHSGTVMRDYLMEHDTSRAEAQRQELQRIGAQMDGTLRSYEGILSEQEKAAFDLLRGPVNSYLKSLAPALHWTFAERRARGETFLRNVVVPQRTEVMQLTQQATALNERDLFAGEERLQSVQSSFGRRVGIISVFALLLGSLLAAISIRRIGNLDQRAQRRYEEAEQARRELANLSERLVNVQEEERRTLSRELHDEVGQVLSAMLVELRRSDVPHGKSQRQLLALQRMAEDCIGKVRNLALLLRPSMLDDLGLVPALKWQARELARRTGLKVKMLADEITENLPDSHRTCVYRVVQEALNNCAKHSQASQVRILVRQEKDVLSITVQDDGIGFDPKQEKGMGLLGMEERVERLGGLFDIGSKAGHGTVLSMRLFLDIQHPAPARKFA